MLRGRGNVSEELSNLGKGEEKSRSCEKEGEICKGEVLAGGMGELRWIRRTRFVVCGL